MSTSTNRHLTTLIRTLQTYSAHQDTPKLLSTVASLLTVLSNPHNLTLLTSQLLAAPAIWTNPGDLRLCLRFFGAFQSAALTICRKYSEDNHIENEQFPPLNPSEWIKGVLLGADERTPTWRHALVIGGILRGFTADDPDGLSPHLRHSVENALVDATNSYLSGPVDADDLSGPCIALVLNYSFEYISDHLRARLNYDNLLPILVSTAFFSEEGFQSAYFLGGFDDDLKQGAEGRVQWPDNSQSFKRLKEMSSRPLVSTMGPLSRLLAHTVENLQESWRIQAMIEDLEMFSKTLHEQWRRNVMSSISASKQSASFDATSLGSTVPKLWAILRSVLFAFVIVLRSAVGRVMNDGALARDTVAPNFAVQTLHILRNLHFVSSRLGSESLSEYSFVFFATTDILSAYHTHVDSFIKDIHPQAHGQIPSHPVDRDLDLFFFNTAEQFTLYLSSEVNENLLVAAALPYLNVGADGDLVATFEAAHSVMLSVFSVPQNADIALKHIPFYIDVLFQSYPLVISQRQFRLAFKTLVQISTPPSLISSTQPELSEVLLDLIHARAVVSDSASRDERPGLVLTLIDTLPLLPIPLLEEWLPATGALIRQVELPMPRQQCRDRFWEVLTNGSMDVEKSRFCVAWWTTKGGRELTLAESGVNDPYTMSGAINAPNSESKI